MRDDQLVKVIQHNLIANTMHLAKSDGVTKRTIKIAGETFQAFFFAKQGKRSYIINNILSVTPVYRKESEVV
ncbi:transcriptional regulator [Lysinibacillus sp. JNUCC 51]|uniref:transcriptional regulator n=1 Tax=Lysinibacillus sp. JNUCC-51 TaxID=2792479 RepID=UPI001936764A|nr:transcriptional regulator [Lysinibacillus sp. JNUCC-51]